MTAPTAGRALWYPMAMAPVTHLRQDSDALEES
jgi:hypothetical protein